MGAVHGAELVSKEEKEKLDEWYVRHASLWVDLRITMMTLVLMMKSHVSHEEAAADSERALSRNLRLEETAVLTVKPFAEHRNQALMAGNDRAQASPNSSQWLGMSQID